MPKKKHTVAPGAFHLSDGWKNCKDEMPPDDYVAIELRFGRDPVPLRTSGRAVHRIQEAFGKPAIAVFWKLAREDH